MTDQLNHDLDREAFVFDSVETDAVLSDIASEMSLLGCLLAPGAATANVAALHQAAELVRPVDFYRPANRIIWERLAAMADRGLPIELPALNAELRTAGDLDRVQGTPYLLHLQEQGLTHANATYFAKMVADVAMRRRMYQTSISIGQIARTGKGDMMALVEEADAQWGQVHATDTAAADGVEHFGEDMMADLIDDLASDEDPMGIPTGYADLDALLNGFHPGELIVVAARPGVGKTTLGLNVATHAAKHGHRSLFVSLEMNRKEIGHRILSAQTSVPFFTIRNKMLKEPDWARLASRREEIASWPLIVSHNPAITFPQVKAEIRRQARKGLKIAVVDYLQLLQDPDSKSADSREREVALMTRGLKVLAQQLEIPIVVLCQLNRDSAKREDKRPHVHELRESGAVEQDANVVLLIHREDVYDKESPRSGEADLIVGKSRNGPMSDVTVAFQGHYSRFVDMAPGV
ncbi:replicative DNA helicase [Nocardiopsis tropica]|uniref:DNA 5'-3' helicase n=1 Tax=Nocardiopsis tropica TaxID=109330 RepID=A0ABV2A4Z7_9ACTN